MVINLWLVLRGMNYLAPWPLTKRLSGTVASDGRKNEMSMNDGILKKGWPKDRQTRIDRWTMMDGWGCDE